MILDNMLTATNTADVIDLKAKGAIFKGGDFWLIVPAVNDVASATITVTTAEDEAVATSPVTLFVANASNVKSGSYVTAVKLPPVPNRYVKVAGLSAANYPNAYLVEGLDFPSEMRDAVAAKF